MSEKLMQDALCQWLRNEGLPFFRQRMDKAATGTKGWPDFSICENGRVLLIETKFGKGKLSTDQLFCHAELAKAGCRVFVVRELSAAIELVNEWRSYSRSIAVQSLSDRVIKFGHAVYRETPRGLEKVRNA